MLSETDFKSSGQTSEHSFSNDGSKQSSQDFYRLTQHHDKIDLNLSIYIENLTNPYNTVSDISLLFEELVGPVTKVYFPPDIKGDNDFRGFCFVEFQNSEFVDEAVKLLNTHIKDKGGEDARGNVVHEQDENSTRKKVDDMKDNLGLRVISGRTFLRLEKEYKDHQAFCRTEIQSHIRMVHGYGSFLFHGEKLDESSEGDKKELNFTPGLVAFAKNTHSETDRTTLKKFFGQSGANVKYIDYTKGTDSCFLRFSTPLDCTTAITYFSNGIAQMSGTDVQGIPNGPNPIQLRLVSGQEEQLYWMQIDKDRSKQSKKRQNDREVQSSKKKKVTI